jgi:hemerythrin-like domain-containing protein
MEYNSQIARLLHDEHMLEVARLERLEGVLQRQGPNHPPLDQDRILTKLLAELIAGVESQSEHHFAFEEEHLFPRLAAQGEADIGRFLASEHETIREIGSTVAGMAKTARQDGFTDETWREFHRLVLELTERTISHIQKEEMGFLPMVEDLLEGEEDSQLALAYMADR